MYHTNSIQGRRPYNEDEFDIFTNLDQTVPGKKINYFGLFDGHGGNHVSKYLKKNLRQYFITSDIQIEVGKSKSCDKYINKVFDFVQNKLTDYHLPSKATGSTALLSLFYTCNNHNMVKVVNLGDCRTVACNLDNIAIPLTKDHKPTSFDEFNRINEMGGQITQEKNDDPRINGLAVSRAFGDLDSKPHVSHLPDVYDYDTRKFKFIIMGCDGIWDVVSNQDAVDLVLSEMDLAKKDPKVKRNIAAKLTQFAYDKGSQDNLTVIVIFI
uniref:PPM-type phosphatase domain-containing protein n=1 Tax=viral metagenome TaxID=1070528 RepID=A0A6C0LZ60_9ZZZZ